MFVRISDTYVTRCHRVINVKDTHDTYEMQLRIRMSSGKKSKNVSILMVSLTQGSSPSSRCALAFGTHWLDFCLSSAAFVQEMLRVSVYCFGASVVKQTTNPSCNVWNRTLGLSDRNRVMPANVHLRYALISARHAKRSSTLCPIIRMPAPRPMSEYHNFCHSSFCHNSRHRRGSLFGHATHMSSVRCEWQDDNQHAQLVVIVADCGPANSRDQTAGNSRRGCLLRCLPIGTSQYAVQFWVS